MTQLNKRQTNKLKKLAKAAQDTQDEPELNKLAVELVKLGFLDQELDQDNSDDPNAQLERFKQLKTLKKELRTQAARAARQVFEQRAQEIFDKDPDLESFGWRQSTPTETGMYDYNGFMRVYSETPFINGVEQEWRNPRDQDGSAGSVRRTVAYLFWTTELEDMFGDGREITVQRDGTIETDHWWPPDY